ncbi:uncharacterized protein DS421_10g303770 [Arachis hypogaea]|nr:uncharacterized protein DS421_10g303770 [Arachis hypogaea]
MIKTKAPNPQTTATNDNVRSRAAIGDFAAQKGEGRKNSNSEQRRVGSWTAAAVPPCKLATAGGSRLDAWGSDGCTSEAAQTTA